MFLHAPKLSSVTLFTRNVPQYDTTLPAANSIRRRKLNSSAMDSHNNNMDEMCDVCGDVGYAEVAATCSLCKLAREHIYCMRVYLKDIPESWVCESCVCLMGERHFSAMVHEDIAPMASQPNTILVDEFGQMHTQTANVASIRQRPHQALTESQGNEDDFVYPSTPNDMTSAKKRVRGASRGVGLSRIIATMGRIKITWTPTQGKPVGRVASLFNGEIGVLVRKFIPLKYEKKKDIPNELYNILTEELLNQFDVDISQPHIKRYINYEIGTLFKDYRSTLYKHYQKYSNPVEARQNPHKYTTPNDWNMLCDRWESSSWKEQSAKNKVSRSKIPFNHRGGSKSFLSHQEDKEKEDGAYVSPIEIFYETHCSASKGWIDPAAKKAHENMLILRQAEEDSSTPKTDEEIMVMVLGKRVSYINGIGYGPKPPRSKDASSYTQEYVESLENRVKKTEELLESQRLESERRSSELMARTEELLEDQRQGYERKFSQINEILKKL